MSKMRTAAIAALSVLIFETRANVPSWQGPMPDVWFGTQSHGFESKAGRVIVTLPDDMRAGDTISGTIAVEPAGRTAAEQQRNRDTLSGYVYDAGGNRIKPLGNVIKFVVPAAGAMALGMFGGGKTRVGATQIMVGPAAQTSGPARLPVIGQAGRPISVPGKFDGDMANTTVMIGDQRADILAESPRSTIFRNPAAATSGTTLRVREGASEQSGPYRVAKVSLSAGKTALLKGERTTVQVQVSGLSGVSGDSARPVDLALQASPTVQLEGGNVQTVLLSPSPAGTASFTRNITALAPGTFDVTAQLAGRQETIRRDPLYPDAIDMNGIDSVLELLSLTAGMNDDAREALLKATLKALRQRLSDATDKATREWLKRKIGIVEGLMDRLGIGH